MKSADVPVSSVAKRLRMKPGFLLRLRKVDQLIDEALLGRRVHHARFHKIHERARQVIQNLLDTAQSPLQLRDF